MRFKGVIGEEGVPTGDGRVIEVGALTWDLSTRIPLRWTPTDTGGHSGAVTIGHLDEIARIEGGKLYGAGEFDAEGENGKEYIRLLQAGHAGGVSMDLDDITAVWEEDEAAQTITERITNGRIRGVTAVDIPAFHDAQIQAVSIDETDYVPPSVVASAIPIDPPGDWFDNPQLTKLTKTTITKDGKVFGHLAGWDTCHIGRGPVCVNAPHSMSNYAHFKTGSIKTNSGAVIPTGVLTMGTGHAGLQENGTTAAAHYDNTGYAVADVVTGEDSFGIWFSGALRPDVTDEQIRALRGSGISGDWRRIGGNLELVAALAVNTPGFPIKDSNYSNKVISLRSQKPTTFSVSNGLQTLLSAGMNGWEKKNTQHIPSAGATSDVDLIQAKRFIDATHMALSMRKG